MSNVFQKIGHGLEDVFVKGPKYLVKAAAVLATAIKDQPKIKQAVLDLVQKASTVVGDVGSAAAQKGINLAADQQTLADAEAFFEYFKNSFIPVIEDVYKEVKADVTGTN